MRSEVVEILWSTGAQQCLLFKVEGRYEVHLRRGERITQLHSCVTADDARRKADEWRRALAASERSA